MNMGSFRGYNLWRGLGAVHLQELCPEAKQHAEGNCPKPGQGRAPEGSPHDIEFREFRSLV